ncbi:MAG: hypothetical protein P4L10_00815 [Acidobacteriaceae bacterium]|nr:hypothetical protein [Acidobacteriaceae bacterium]
MTTNLNSVSSTPDQTPDAERHHWLKVGFVAVASGVLGGLAAAWYYRKTLAELRKAESEGPTRSDANDFDDHYYDI